MTAQAWQFYDTVHLWLADGTFDLDADTFKLALYLSTSNAGTLTNSVLADLTNEHANANGYTTGGITLSGVTWTRSGATATFDFADAVWTAAGGSIICRRAVLYKSGTANARVNPLVATSLLDTTPADITVTDGNTLTIQTPAQGAFTVTG